MAETKASLSENRVSTVDSLRGIACLAVCWFHFTNASPSFLPAGLLKYSAAYGQLGPVIFFVISGFVVPYSLGRNAYRLRNYPAFLLKRLVRLHPPYLISIGAIIVIGLVSSKIPGYRGEPFMVSATQLALHFGYLNAIFGRPWLNPVFWTLAIEFQYYLVIGLVYPGLVHKNRLVRYGIIAGLAALALAFPLDYLVLECLFLFMMGWMVFSYKRGQAGVREFFVVILLMATGAYFILGATIALLGVATAVTIAFVDLRGRLLAFFGMISYSLYLIHLPIGTRILNLGERGVSSFGARVALALATLGICSACAYVLYRMVELPVSRWASAIPYSRRPKEVTAYLAGPDIVAPIESPSAA